MSAMKRLVRNISLISLYMIPTLDCYYYYYFRLPFDIDHVLKLLLSLSQDELSSQRVYLLLNECNHYTEECPDGVQQGTTVVLKHPRVLFERGRPDLCLLLFVIYCSKNTCLWDCLLYSCPLVQEVLLAALIQWRKLGMIVPELYVGKQYILAGNFLLYS